MELSKREKKLLIFAVLIIITVILVKNFILPGIDRYFALQNEINELEHQLNKTRLVIRDEAKYRKMLKEAQQKLDQLKEALYQRSIQEVRLELINAFDYYLQEAGLEAESKELRVIEPEDSGPTVLNYQVVLRGAPEAVGKFLDMVVNAKKHLEVTELSMTGNEHDTKLSVTISIEAYCIGGNTIETES